MILYYAMGGGLGHLTRARAVAHTLALDDVRVLTASKFAYDPRVMGKGRTIHVPPALAGDPVEYRAWLKSVLDELVPEAIYVDTFPAGIVGELAPLTPKTALFHVARHVRWGAYHSPAMQIAFRFAATYVLEELHPDQAAYLHDVSDALTPLVLHDPPPAACEEDIDEIVARLRDQARPLWLVVHSGPADEIAQLVSYAREMAAAEEVDPRIVVVAPAAAHGDDAAYERVDLYPALPLVERAARVITACGFNAMRQMEPYRERHRFMPFPRRYDDQFLRAHRRRSG